jgi:dTDP-glucose 4,6-dehydratase
VDRSISDPQIFTQTNVLGTVNLLQCAKEAWQTGDDSYREHVRYLQVSTDEVYGSLGPEGFFTEQTPLDPHSPYAASKAAADLFVKAFGDTYKLPVNITRCSNNYGPFQFPEKLIPLMLNNALHKQPLPVYGDGMQIRDWLYVEDHCKAIDLVLERGTLGEVYNIGGHNERTNIQIVTKIIDYVREHVDSAVDEGLIEHVTDRKGHDRRYGIDPAKIKAALGWQPETAFEDGITKTMQWYLNNQDWVTNVTSGAYRDYYARMYKTR